MKRCKIKVYINEIKKFKRCLRETNHGGTHSPNLKGEKFGKLKVLKFAGRRRWKKRTYFRWWVDCNGLLKMVDASELRRGQTLGFQNTGTGFVSKKNGKVRPEYSTVSMHFHYIFDGNNKAYKGMPFFKEWNPNKKGGAFWKGAKWIIENLGAKPSKKWSLDIVNHSLGFVPGNLRWALRHTQIRNQKHRKLGNFSIKELKVEVRRHGYKLVKM